MARPRKNPAENEVELETAAMQESVDVATETIPESASEPTSESTAQDEIVEQKEETPHANTKDVNVELLLKKMAEMERQLNESKMVKDDVVHLLYIDSVSDDNELNLGEFGYIRGSSGSLDVSRKDFGSRFMSPLVRWLLNTRRLIVLDGLTADERKRYGVDYKDGEVLDMQAFDRLLDMNAEQACSIFDRLCVDHKWFAARRFITAFERGDNRVSREKVEALNALSKSDSIPKGMFAPVLEGMNKI